MNSHSDILKSFYENFLKIQPYDISTRDPGHESDSNRAEIRAQILICKPIVQRALASAIIRLTYAEGSFLLMSDVVERINNVDWSTDNPDWQCILINGDKIITGNGAMSFAARIISYLLGEKLEEKQVSKLKEQFSIGTDGKELIDPFFKD